VVKQSLQLTIARASFLIFCNVSRFSYIKRVGALKSRCQSLQMEPEIERFIFNLVSRLKSERIFASIEEKIRTILQEVW